MRYLSLLLLISFTSIFGMHHEKLDVIVFAIDLEIIDGQKNSANNFVSRITENVNNKEPQTLVYQYHFSNEKNKVFLLEIYPNNEAALIHMNNFLGSKWEAESAPEPLPMPLQPMVAEPALQKVNKLAAGGHEGAKDLATYWVGQGVGLMNQSISASDVVQEFKEDFINAFERLNNFVS